MDSKIKVVWITHFSNSKIRKRLRYRNSFLERFLRRILNRPKAQLTDNCQWITNGINEYEKVSDVELHIVAPHIAIDGIQEFVIDNIHYHFFQSENDYSFFIKLFRKPILESDYSKNRSIIKLLISQIKPDLIHIIGAENPYYSLSALDIDVEKYPLIVSLQTLMSAKGFKDNYLNDDNLYEYRSSCEREVIKHAKYIGSRVKRSKDIVWSSINPSAIFLNTTLFLGEKIDRNIVKKEYDIIYFARDIVKAADIALNVLANVARKRPNITMCIVGGCNQSFRVKFESLLDNLNIRKNVIVLGNLRTHDDVLSAVKRSRVALLPVKVDGISGTIREAMANGVPVVTTKTWGTPSLNERRRSAFVEEIDDYESMSTDIINLLEDTTLYKELQENAYFTCDEKYSNEAFAKIQNKIYHALVDFKEKGIPIPTDLYSINPMI